MLNLNIPTKCESAISTLKDALRILCWQNFKESNNLKGEEALLGYQEFSDLWKAHEIQKMELPQVYKFIESLGWDEEALMEIRREYYEKKAKYSKSSSNFPQSVDRQIGF
jgi:hypothetical protein